MRETRPKGRTVLWSLQKFGGGNLVTITVQKKKTYERRGGDGKSYSVWKWGGGESGREGDNKGSERRYKQTATVKWCSFFLTGGWGAQNPAQWASTESTIKKKMGRDNCLTIGRVEKKTCRLKQ